MLFKVLNDDGTSLDAHRPIQWPLPTKSADGTWASGKGMPLIEGPLNVRDNGYHLCTMEGLPFRIGPAIFVAEYRGDRLDVQGEAIVREVRLSRKVEIWNELIAQLFVYDCAEHVLHIFEKRYPDDHQPRQAIEVGRRFASGKAGQEETEHAAWAAWSISMAARNAIKNNDEKEELDWDGQAIAWAAGAAAYAAMCTVQIATGNVQAAWADAKTAVPYAVRAVWGASGDPWSHERHWQASRLAHYLEM